MWKAPRLYKQDPGKWEAWKISSHPGQTHPVPSINTHSWVVLKTSKCLEQRQIEVNKMGWMKIPTQPFFLNPGLYFWNFSFAEQAICNFLWSNGQNRAYCAWVFLQHLFCAWSCFCSILQEIPTEEHKICAKHRIPMLSSAGDGGMLWWCTSGKGEARWGGGGGMWAEFVCGGGLPWSSFGSYLGVGSIHQNCRTWNCLPSKSHPKRATNGLLVAVKICPHALMRVQCLNKVDQNMTTVSSYWVYRASVGNTVQILTKNFKGQTFRSWDN